MKVFHHHMTLDFFFFKVIQIIKMALLSAIKNEYYHDTYIVNRRSKQWLIL
jgi:hypothetical protein